MICKIRLFTPLESNEKLEIQTGTGYISVLAKLHLTLELSIKKTLSLMKYWTAIVQQILDTSR